MRGFIIEDQYGRQATMIARIYDFLKKPNPVLNSRSDMRTEYSGRDAPFRYQYKIDIFPVGYGKENLGYVSIQFGGFDGTCIVSLIDASETRRFSQSFTLIGSSVHTIEKYISHEQLLSDPGDLLPNGILTLMIYVQLTSPNQSYENYNIVKTNVPLKLLYITHEIGSKFTMLQDTQLAKRLSEKSNVFCEILESTIDENRKKNLLTYTKDFLPFNDIVRLLIGFNPLIFQSIEQILNMFIIADKYDIPFVSKTCTCFMKLYAYVHGVEELSAYVQEYVKIEHLKKLLQTQIGIINHTNFDDEIYTIQNRFYYTEPVHGYIWVYIIDADVEDYRFYKDGYAETTYISDENEEYDFYK